MDYVREILPSSIVERFITIPSSMRGKNIEVILLPSNEKSAVSQLRGMAETNLSLEDAREERLKKYEIVA